MLCDRIHEDMTHLILIGGAPGVGKSTVARKIFTHLDNCVWLDGDNLWRMNPFIVNEKTKQMVERNIHYVLRSFIKEDFSYVLFTWVLHLNQLLNGFCQPFPDHNLSYSTSRLSAANRLSKLELHMIPPELGT